MDDGYLSGSEIAGSHRPTQRHAASLVDAASDCFGRGSGRDRPSWTALLSCKRRSCLVGGPHLEFLFSGAVRPVCAERSCPEAVVANRTASPAGHRVQADETPVPPGGTCLVV